MIKGERVTLRRVEPEDYPLILEWQNDPEVFRWMDYDREFSLEDIRRSEEKGAQEGHPFVILAEGRPIGRIGIFGIKQRTQNANLYIFIGDRDLTGHGYAREALTLLLDYGFSTLNLRLVQLWTLADNDRAIRLYKGIGFIEEARLRDRTFHDGVVGDSIIMSITRDEFRQARATRES